MITEDLTTYFNSTDAEAATIQGVASSVYGFLSWEYVEVEVGRAAIAGYKPTFTCQYSDVSAVSTGATVSVEGQDNTFTVVLIQPPDVSGGCVIILEEA